MLYKQRSSFSNLDPSGFRRHWSISSPCFPPRVTAGIDYRPMSGMRRLDTSAFDTSPPVCVQTKDICIKLKPSCCPDPLHNSWVLSPELLGVDRLVHLLNTRDSLLCVISGEVRWAYKNLKHSAARCQNILRECSNILIRNYSMFKYFHRKGFK